ncbi:MAG: tripartite tricarboxylate transporter substrate-binding protein [Beijerinckiaceae bacterium]|nr:tripartite tricarboxylate transporter substrate-binding protein [Beijerinckiaceae bacterium]
MTHGRARAAASFAALLVAATILVGVGPSLAQSPEQFYRGKSVELLVGYAPGGLNDTLSRVVARHIGRKIPGEPSIVVRNMSSAGPIGIANHMYTAAEKDGSVIASLDRTGAQLSIRGELAARFDPLKFNWLGSIASFERDAYLLLVNTGHAARSAKDLQGGVVKAIIGSVGAGSTNQVFAMLAKEALKLNLDTVKGYRGTGPIFLAMQSGEVDGVVTGISTLTTTQADLWNNKKVRALVQFGRATRHPLLPDVPTGRELAPDAQTQALIKFAELPFQMSRPFIAPPDLPADRAKALKEAFMATMKDPDFIAELDKIKFDDLSPIDGEAILALVREALQTPKATIEKYNQIEKSGG